MAIGVDCEGNLSERDTLISVRWKRGDATGGPQPGHPLKDFDDGPVYSHFIL